MFLKFIEMVKYFYQKEIQINKYYSISTYIENLNENTPLFFLIIALFSLQIAYILIKGICQTISLMILRVMIVLRKGRNF